MSLPFLIAALVAAVVLPAAACAADRPRPDGTDGAPVGGVLPLDAVPASDDPEPGPAARDDEPTAPPPPGVEALSPAERERLASGDPVVLDGGGVGEWVEAVVAVDAAAEDVWAVMVDCLRAPEFVPRLLDCRVLESDGETALVEHTTRPSRLLPEMTYVFRERREPFRSIRFRRVSGSLARLEGRWDLTRGATGRTLVWYTISLDPGFLVPDWAVRRALARDLPELLTALKRRVEGAE